MKQQQELIPMATGEYLKSLRLERKLSLAEVARSIILDERLLGEIEDDRAEHIAPLYRNGYIRTYARFLKVPEDEIAALLASSDVKEADLRSIFNEPPKRNSAEKWLRASSYVLASLLVGTLAWQFTHEAVRLSQNGPRLQNGAATVPASGDMANTTQQQEFSGPVNASIAPLGVLHSKTANGLDTAEQAWAALSKPVLPDGESRLQIHVSADSWVEITDASGQQLEMDLLRGGSDRDYHGQAPFRILFGRASAVRLSMDGEAVDLTPFTREDVAQLTWPQKLQAENDEPDGN
ncbi:MAG TPA: RodZ domain-containing protein [Xanthomonadales bacterium]